MAKKQPSPSRAEKVKPVKPVKAWAWKWTGRTNASSQPGFIFPERYRCIIVPDDGSYTVTPKAGRRK